jgi:hypothetical protein
MNMFDFLLLPSFISEKIVTQSSIENAQSSTEFYNVITLWFSVLV